MSLHSSIPRIPFTADAYAKMQEEHEKLVIEQEELIVRVNVARAQGDLSENGAYKYGKIELGNVRRRLRELKHFLKHAQIIQPKKHPGVIDFGSTITLKSGSKTMTFTLVSKFESDPAQNKLSDQSPIGKEVKGKRVGDKIIVTIPSGQTTYVIEKVG